MYKWFCIKSIQYVEIKTQMCMLRTALYQIQLTAGLIYNDFDYSSHGKGKTPLKIQYLFRTVNNFLEIS